MSRRRIKKNQNLEPNLYHDAYGFVYRNPITKKKTRINRTLAEANALARKANHRVMSEKQLGDISLLGKMTQSDDYVFSTICDSFFDEVIEKGNNKQGTKDNKRYVINRFKKDLGKQLIYRFTIKQLSDYLEKNFTNVSYIKHRAVMIDIFKYAKARGLYDGENPAAATLEKTGDKKVRKRHTWEGLQKIIEASEPWLQRAIKIALYTLQRREDIVEIKKDQVRGDYIYLKQNKTEGAQFNSVVYLKIKMGDELKEVVRECMMSPIPSPYLIHYKPKTRSMKKLENKAHWTCVTPNHLTKSFSKARINALAYPKLSTAEQPSFHEIRAFGSWLYEFRAGFGHDYVQALMGHTSGKMTTGYQEGHEISYAAVEAGLQLQELDI